MKRTLPPLKLLEAFVAVGSLQNLEKAGNQLNLTKSAVSQQIKQLEQFYNFPLFQRDRDGIHLNTDGEKLYQCASQVLRQLEHVSGELLGSRRGGVTLNISPTLAIEWLFPLLPAFNEKHPEINVEIQSSWQWINRRPALGELSIVEETDLPKEFEAKELWQKELVLCGQPDLIGNRSLEDLMSEMRIVVDYDSRIDEWKAWRRANHLNEPENNKKRMASNSQHGIEYAKNGLGVFVTQEKFIRREIERGELVIAKGSRVQTDQPTCLIYHKSLTLTQNQRNLIAWLMTHTS